MNLLTRIKKLDWTVLQYLGILGFLGFFWKPELKFFFLFYLIDFFRLFRNSKEAEKESKGKNLRRYYLTSFLSQVNPFTLFQVTLQLLGQVVIVLRNFHGLPNKDNYKNKAIYILPFKDEWFVANGGSTKINSHSWDILTQRYAYDFLMVSRDNNSFQNHGKKLSDYYCYGKEVIAPADGVVVRINNKVKDYTSVGDFSIDWKTRDFHGNFIIIKHADKEFSFIAHLQLNSIRVKKGQIVNQGQVIGLCGNSGHSTEPHIHFHLQDNQNIWIAAGLPIRFKKIAVKMEHGQIIIRANDFVEKNEVVKNPDN
jgi:hypothetical protein